MSVSRRRIRNVAAGLALLVAGSIGVAGYSAWDRFNTNGCVSHEPARLADGSPNAAAGQCNGYMTPREVWHQAGTPGERL